MNPKYGGVTVLPDLMDTFPLLHWKNRDSAIVCFSEHSTFRLGCFIKVYLTRNNMSLCLFQIAIFFSSD